jgi:peptidoglycan/xylan/chitin deacetylase (PgdA/CDA1 family)
VVLVVLLVVVLLLLTAWLHPRWLLRFISWATLPQRVIFYKSPSSSPSSSSSSSTSEHEPLISGGPATQRRRRRVALTIDDAPHGEVTPYLLDELRRHECRATFFCIGAQVAAAPKALLRRMVDEGHELGNHMMHDMAT